MLITGTTANYAAKVGTANAALVPSDLDKGSVGIYGKDKTTNRDVLIVSGSTATGKINAAAFTGESFKLCEGLGGGKFKVSEFLYTKGVDKINSSVYRAPVAWKAYIGNNGTSGQILIDTLNPTRNEVMIEIREVFSNRERGVRQYYDILLVPGETVTTVLTKIKAALDVGVEGVSYFTTVINGGNTGLSLTALDTSKEYEINIQGAIEDSTITIQAGDRGAGTYAGLRPYEILSQAKHGNLYTSDREYKTVADSLVEGTTYDTYVIGAVNAHVPGGYGGAGLAGNAKVATSVEVVVVFPHAVNTTAGGNQTEFEAILEAITGIEFSLLVAA